MAYTSIKRRIKKIQSGGDERYLRILELIDQGAYYDELTPEEQALYKEYKESLGGGDSDYAAAYLSEAIAKAAETEGVDREPPPEHGYYHYRLTKRTRPPTPEEHAQRVQEVQEIFDRIAREEMQDE